MKQFLVAGLALLIATSSAHAAVYKWLDEEGVMHFSDQPPPTHIKNFETARVRRGQTSDATAALPYTLQEPVKNFPVVLYASACGKPCDQARQFLQKRGVPHTEKDAGDAAVQSEMAKLLDGDTVVVPLLTVGRALQRGYEENAWNSALDSAGYPKSSVLPPKVAAPARPAAPTKKAGEESKGDAPAKKSAGQYPVPQ
jgi:hypothetical protein